MITGFVYIIKCKDGSYYTGVSNDPEARFWQHENGIGSEYTSRRRPLELVWVSDEVDIMTAIEFEKRVKGWRREKKEALINHREDLLPILAKLKKGEIDKIDPSSSSG
ncbi:MAG: GIY-YIG nuclease family protein [Candidatus Marinimicrobia bacterium]|jgi:putative endonuclease|nr:GIY-YIG nuclease family protein [Candidatus Neomarinimicrobiota bacterium]MDP6991652.1 GIY-YIG nuclease family protein [Candidatus Neomarinimicrobiota bacterium]